MRRFIFALVLLAAAAAPTIDAHPAAEAPAPVARYTADDAEAIAADLAEAAQADAEADDLQDTEFEYTEE